MKYDKQFNNCRYFVFPSANMKLMFFFPGWQSGQIFKAADYQGLVACTLLFFARFVRTLPELGLLHAASVFPSSLQRFSVFEACPPCGHYRCFSLPASCADPEHPTVTISLFLKTVEINTRIKNAAAHRKQLLLYKDLLTSMRQTTICQTYRSRRDRCHIKNRCLKLIFYRKMQHSKVR